MQRTGTAIVAGGSIGGLFAAAALLKAGWSVRVLERARVELAGRGAGIVTHQRLNDAFSAVGANTTDLGVPVQDRVAFDISCSIVKKMSCPQIVTSWDRIHQILRALIPEGAYHLGQSVVGYEKGKGGSQPFLMMRAEKVLTCLSGQIGFALLCVGRCCRTLSRPTLGMSFGVR